MPEPGSDKLKPEGAGWKAYIPLLVIVALSLLTSAVLQYPLRGTSEPMLSFMRCFMGMFLIFFSMLKLFDISGFVRGFALYDLAASKVRAYGYIYPFLELFFGLALLSGWQLKMVNAGLALLMFFGAAGVFRALGQGKKLKCACMGSSLNVPLSTVAVVEDLGMGLMALAMLGLAS